MPQAYLGGSTIMRDGWMGRSASHGPEYTPNHAAAEAVVREVRPPFKGMAKGGRIKRKPQERAAFKRRDLLDIWEKAFELFRERSDLSADPRGDSRARSAMERAERLLPADVADELVSRRLDLIEEMRAERSAPGM